MKNEEYLGDSVYVKFDGYSFTVYTNNGEGPENEIIMEPEVVRSLLRFIDMTENSR